MMENKIKITSEVYTKIMQSMPETKYTLNWNGMGITVNHTISLQKVLTFVDNVVKMCFSEDDATYLPEVKDFAIKSCILEMYANIELPSNIEARYAFIYNTDLFNVIMEHVNHVQIDEIISAINHKLNHLAKAHIESIHMQMNELYNAFNGLQAQASKFFEAIKEEDINNLVNAMSNGKLDESKLVEAYATHFSGK